LGGIIIGVLLVSGYAALVTAYSPIVVNGVAIILMMMAGTAVLMHYYRYWKSIKLTL
jgi:ABC-2 type transport system permease protein